MGNDTRNAFNRRIVQIVYKRLDPYKSNFVFFPRRNFNKSYSNYSGIFENRRFIAGILSKPDDLRGF